MINVEEIKVKELNEIKRKNEPAIKYEIQKITCDR